MSNTVAKHLMRPLNNSRGAAAVMVALTMTVLLAMGAAAIDIGHALVARNELQNVSDSAALAGTRALGFIYEGMTPAAQQAYVLTGGDQAIIQAAVQTAANANKAAGVAISINQPDIQIGIWNPATRTLTPTANQPKSVRVLSRRDAAANGVISTFLANVVGMSSVSVSAVATADLTAVLSVAPGDMNAPFGISEFYFNSGFGCGSTIQFSPSIPGDPQTCAGWQVFDQTPFNNSTFVSMVNGMANGTYTPPGGQAGIMSLTFGNGNLGNPAWGAMTNLWQAQVAANGTWNALVPVYAGSDCSPSGPQLVIGFATVQITYVGGPGDPNNALNCTGNTATGCIAGTIQCNVFNGAGGGGTPFGPTFGTIPGLVE